MTEESEKEARRRQEAVSSQRLSWGPDILKLEFQDWDAALLPEDLTVASPPAESYSNQEDATSVPNEAVEGEQRKRLRRDFRVKSDLNLSDSGRRESQDTRRQGRARSSGKLSSSPREPSSDSGKEYKGQRSSSRHRKHFFDQLEKPDPVSAAKSKASRERLRRERLNESFVELTKTLDPEKYVRAEKTTIIAETIKMLQGMRMENQELRKEAQALRERVAESEKEKDTLLFQQSLLKQELETAQAANYSQHHSGGGFHTSAGIHAPVVAMGFPMGGVQQQRPQLSNIQGHDFMQQQHGQMQGPRPSPLLQQRHQPQREASMQEELPAVSDAFMLPSSLDLSDADFNRELVALASGEHSMPQLTSAMTWLPSTSM